jgi:hypothetical protein
VVRFAFALVGAVQPAPSHTISEYVPRGVRSGIASSVIRKHWDAAEIYPQARNPALRPTPEQVQMLRMFQPVPTQAGATELPDLLGGSSEST